MGQRVVCMEPIGPLKKGIIYTVQRIRRSKIKDRLSLYFFELPAKPFHSTRFEIIKMQKQGPKDDKCSCDIRVIYAEGLCNKCPERKK